ncbi:MAG: nucleotidyltransferase [Prevotellaceae bacterium]|nr:nucleotidyltransferase [Candidatus Faecinaster equi]
MKAVGIIAEYNPLHIGHKYHIAEALRFAGSDAVVVAMSGDYVQRGEPAILDKWERTKIALENGADLVVEIPTLFCLADAGGYAGAGVKILESLGCASHLAYGSESGEVEPVKKMATNLKNSAADIDNRISELVKTGKSYPVARSLAYEELFGEKLPDSSNDILGLEYVKACSALEPIAVKRVGAGYNDDVPSGEYMSASGIRNAVIQGVSVDKYVPQDTADALMNNKLTFADDWMKTLKYAAMSMTAEEIDSCPSGGEGLGNRIKSLVNEAESWNQFAELVKSKRYTHTRISRLFTQMILGINRDDFGLDDPAYIRILGMNETGRALLSQINNQELSTLPIITNICKQRELLDDKGLKQLELDIRGADIYNLVTGRNQADCSVYRMKPIIL